MVRSTLMTTAITILSVYLDAAQVISVLTSYSVMISVMLIVNVVPQLVVAARVTVLMRSYARATR